jgi:hypothetical protein
MSKLVWIADKLSGRRIERETARHLAALSHGPALISRRRTTELLQSFRAEPGPKVTLGQTLCGEPVSVSLGEILHSTGQISGGMGAGKTRAAGNILRPLIDLAAYDSTIGFGAIDAKRELYLLTLFLLAEKLIELERSDPDAADRIRRRIFICDFACADPITPYNVVSPWADGDHEFFASSRTDLLLDMLQGGDDLSLSGRVVLQKLILLLGEFRLPIRFINAVLDNECLLRRLVARSQNESVVAYFSQRFRDIPKPTIAALQRRIESLLSSQGVRLALNGPSAPDFRRLQDESAIVLVNCFGSYISRSVRRLLHHLVISDVTRAIFARRKTNRPFLWICDEAQNFFATPTLRENMAEVLTMGRSFASFFLFLTQNVSTAVQDPRVLTVLHTNLKWALALRSDPSDCSFLRPALPATGRRVRPDTNPFAQKTYYSITEERALALDEVGNLPDRVGWIWFKGRSSGAIKIETQELEAPQGPQLEAATLHIQRDPAIGMRLAKAEYERVIEERNREWREPQEESALPDRFEKKYQEDRNAWRA